MMENIVTRMEDKDGIWELDSNGVTWSLITPSDSFLEEKDKEPDFVAPEPTQDDFILDLAFRLAMLEAGF